MFILLNFYISCFLAPINPVPGSWTKCDSDSKWGFTAKLSFAFYLLNTDFFCGWKDADTKRWRNWMIQSLKKAFLIRKYYVTQIYFVSDLQRGSYELHINTVNLFWKWIPNFLSLHFLLNWCAVFSCLAKVKCDSLTEKECFS